MRLVTVYDRRNSRCKWQIVGAFADSVRAGLVATVHAERTRKWIAQDPDRQARWAGFQVGTVAADCDVNDVPSQLPASAVVVLHS